MLPLLRNVVRTVLTIGAGYVLVGKGALAEANPHPAARFLTIRTGLVAQQLAPGRWLPSAVTGPQVERFSFALQKGQFAAIGVRQLTGNVAVAVFGPSGQMAGLADRSGTGAEEVLTWTAGESGTYSAQVAMFEWDAPQARFEIALTAKENGGGSPAAIASQLFDAWHAKDYPGAALAVVQNGEIVLDRVGGLATLSPENPINRATRFELASVSKQFTGLAVAVLAERGLIDIDGDIRTYVPGVPDFGQKITIRHLLTHRSGLRDWDAGLGLAGRPIESGITQDDVLAFVSRQKSLNFPPGSQQNYSNTNYSLLAVAVEKALGKPFEQFLTDEIFAPLKMSAVSAASPNAPIDHMAQSFRGRFPAPYAASVKPISTVGASAVYASLDDMIAWIRAIRDRRAGGTSVAWARFLAPAKSPDTEDYAYGLWRNTRSGSPFLGHLGLAAGYRISFRYFTSRDLGVVYMTNDGNDAAYDRAKQIEDLFLGIPEKAFEPPDAEYTPAAAIDDAAQFSGRFGSDELQTAYDLVAQGKRLVARHRINGDIELTRVDGDAFTSSFPFMPDVRFRRNASGAVDAMIVSTESAQNIIFSRVPGY
jgi:CubicO group peptidase (beta-lactamase class C family)